MKSHMIATNVPAQEGSVPRTGDSSGDLDVLIGVD